MPVTDRYVTSTDRPQLNSYTRSGNESPNMASTPMAMTEEETCKLTELFGSDSDEEIRADDNYELASYIVAAYEGDPRLRVFFKAKDTDQLLEVTNTFGAGGVQPVCVDPRGTVKRLDFDAIPFVSGALIRTSLQGDFCIWAMGYKRGQKPDLEECISEHWQQYGISVEWYDLHQIDANYNSEQPSQRKRQRTHDDGADDQELKLIRAKAQKFDTFCKAVGLDREECLCYRNYRNISRTCMVEICQTCTLKCNK